jgi:hypothetical protein
MMKALTSPENERVAKGYIDDLRAGKFAEIDKDFDPSIKGKNDLEELSKMGALIPEGDPISVKTVGAYASTVSYAATSQTVSRWNLIFEYEFPNKWLAINVAVQTKGSSSTIIGFHVNAMDQSLETRNRFGLVGKTTLQYAVLVAAIASVALSIYACVLCVRTKMQRRKWLWILATLLGIGKLSVDWATGNWGFQLLSLQLLSASAVAAPYGPWYIAASIPLGAIIFLIKRKSLTALPTSL